MTEHYDTVVVGAGQAGLATGYHLARQGRRSSSSTGRTGPAGPG